MFAFWLQEQEMFPIIKYLYPYTKELTPCLEQLQKIIQTENLGYSITGTKLLIIAGLLYGCLHGLGQQAARTRKKHVHYKIMPYVV